MATRYNSKPTAGRNEKTVSVHELDPGTRLRFRSVEDATGDARKSAMHFLTEDGSQSTNLVAFKELNARSELQVYRKGVALKIKTSELQQEDVVYASPLSRLQRESVFAFRSAYGTEDWIIADFRAWAVCCQIANIIRPIKKDQEVILWSRYRTGCESFKIFTDAFRDKNESAQTWKARFDAKPLEFRLVGHGTKEAGAARWSELGRRRPDTEKFDVEIYNPNTGKSVFLEVSGCGLAQYSKKTMWVQKAKMDHALKHPERLNVFALAHHFDGRPPITSQSPWDHHAVDYIVLNENSSTRYDTRITLPNRSHVTEEFYAYNSDSMSGHRASNLIRDKNSTHLFAEIMAKLDYDDRPYRTLRMARDDSDRLTPGELAKLTRDLKPPDSLIDCALAIREDLDMAARPRAKTRDTGRG